MQLIDSHCHLDFAAFADDLDQVVANAGAVGVEQFIIPGVAASSWPSLVELTRQRSNFHCALGVHPYFLETYREQDFALLEQMLAQHNTVAVGECGIDASIADPAKQQAIFERHIALANDFNKPLIVHHRKSHHHIFQSFNRVKPKCGGAIHAFSGSAQDAQKYIDLGFKLGVGGGITYDRANKTRQAICTVPISALLLETDSPDMPLSGRQGRRNEPQNLPLVLQTLAQLRRVDKTELAQQLTANTKSLFNL